MTRLLLGLALAIGLSTALSAAPYAIVDGSGTVQNVVEWDGVSAFSPGAGLSLQPVTPTLLDKYAAAHPAATVAVSPFQQRLSAGLTITSTGTPAISGTYPVDPSARTNLSGLIAGAYARCGTTPLASCATAFPHNAATYPLLDVAGAAHVVTAGQMQAIGEAIEDYASDLIQAAGQPNPVWPSASATIP